MELPTHPILEFTTTKLGGWTRWIKTGEINSKITSLAWIEILSPYRNYFILSNN